MGRRTIEEYIEEKKKAAGSIRQEMDRLSMIITEFRKLVKAEAAESKKDTDEDPVAGNIPWTMDELHRLVPSDLIEYVFRETKATVQQFTAYCNINAKTLMHWRNGEIIPKGGLEKPALDTMRGLLDQSGKDAAWLPKVYYTALDNYRRLHPEGGGR